MKISYKAFVMIFLSSKTKILLAKYSGDDAVQLEHHDTKEIRSGLLEVVELLRNDQTKIKDTDTKCYQVQVMIS